MPSPQVYDSTKDVNANVRKRAVSCAVHSSAEIDALVKKTSDLSLRNRLETERETNTSDIAEVLKDDCDPFAASTPSTIDTPCLFSSPVHESTSKCSSNFHSDKLWRKYSGMRQKARKFGSSDVDAMAKPNFTKVLKQRKLHPKMAALKTVKRSCKIFSACVTPCASPARSSFVESFIYRLSGIAMSPDTPISWAAESPIELNPQTSPGLFMWRENPNNAKIPLPNSANLQKEKCARCCSSRRLKITKDGCPPDKLYFWQDDLSELKTDDKLGRGGFGQVYEGTYRGTKVAVKKLQTEFKHKKVVFENFLGELHSLRLNHPNLVRSLVLVQPPNSPTTPAKAHTSFLVMEYAGSQNLLKVINDSNETIPHKRRCKFCVDILSGLCYLHSKGLAHLDLKPNNIILTENGDCKICDFGSCKMVEAPSEQASGSELSWLSSISGNSGMFTPSTGGSNFSFKSGSGNKQGSLLMGTLIYRAPELLRGIQPTLKADIFSFAITAWEIWQRSNPYPGLHQHTAVFTIVAFNRRPCIPEIVQSEDLDDRFDAKYVELVQSCWAGDPNDRPTADSVLKDIEQWSEML